MNKLLAKMGLGEKMSKNFLAILIVAFSGAIIYGLPYFRFDYYDVYLETYHLTNVQMGVFGSVLGVFGMISYLFGGIVADRFSTRTILTVSLLGTGIGGLVHLLPLNFPALVCLYAFWGVSSLFAFWPACVKAVRILSGSGDQGKAFGFFEGGRGVAAALMAMAAVVAFRIGAGQMEDQAQGMKYVIVFYSVLTILMGVLISISISIVVLLFDRPLLQIFNITGESLRRAKEHLDILMFFIWTSTITNITCGFLQGAGDVKIPAASGFINLGIRLALSFLLALTPVGFRCYYVSMPPAWLIACFVVVMRYRSGKWREFRIVKE